MESVIYVDSDEMELQKKKLYDSDPNHSHSYFRYTTDSLARFQKTQLAVMETQNGRDTDDYVIGKNNRHLTRVQKYLPNGKKLLSIGCGTGRDVAMFRDNGYSCEGITLGPRNVKFAQQVFGIQIQTCDIHATPFPDREFDGVIASHTMEHSYAPLILLLEMNRILKPGGRIIIETPPYKDFTYGDNPHHVLCPTVEQMDGLLLKSNFKVIFSEEHGTLLWVGERKQDNEVAQHWKSLLT